MKNYPAPSEYTRRSDLVLSRNAVAWTLMLATLVFPWPAAAAGFGRPNVLPLGLGIGGAGYAGVANPTTIHYNPAGMILMSQTVVMAGVEFIRSSLGYEDARGRREESASGWELIPSLGVSTRFSRRDGKSPAPFAFGLGFYNSFGVSTEFDKQQVQPGVTRTRVLLLELVPAVAYRVSRELALGIGVRIGFGIFNLASSERRGVEKAPYDLSGSGMSTIGAEVGATFQPLDWLRVGLVYGSPMQANMKGTGSVDVGGDNWVEDTVSWSVPFPQWAALGVALGLHPSFDIYTGLRWIDWSVLKETVIDFSVVKGVVERLNFSDAISAHLGCELRFRPARWNLHRQLAVTAGLSYDGNTIPNATLQRGRQDTDKLTVGMGLSVGILRSWFIDLAWEALFGFPRTVQDVAQMDPTKVGPPPGRYTFAIFSMGSGIRYVY